MLASLVRGLAGAPLSAVAAGGALRAAAAGLLLTQHAGSGRSAWEQPCRRLATAVPSDPSLIRNFAIIGEAPLQGQPQEPLGQGWPAAMHVPSPPAAAACRHRLPPHPSLSLLPCAAHVDHGKTTLMDRLLNHTGATLT